jgi:MerR family copper efflux transcriptional regulator
MNGVRTISRLAREAGVKVSTVRFYERRGLLDASRTRKGYRAYDDAALRRLRFIRRAADLGFSLDEIETVLSASEDGFIREPALRTAALSKVKDLQARIEDLERLKVGIETLLRRRKPGAECPLLDALVPCE